VKYLLFVLGAAYWHIRAGFWYVGLAFRLYFAVGLDKDYDPSNPDVSRYFRCPIERRYRRFLPA